MNNTKLLSDQFKGLKAAIAAMPDGTSLKSACQSFLVDAISTLSELKSTHTQAYEQSERMALHLASLANCLAGHFAGMNRDLEESKRRGAEITSTQAWLVAEVARSIAVSAWAGDDLHEYRIGEMSAIVYRELERLGYAQRDQSGKQKPTLRAIREWITTVAPGYAHDPGAEKKQDE